MKTYPWLLCVLALTACQKQAEPPAAPVAPTAPTPTAASPASPAPAQTTDAATTDTAGTLARFHWRLAEAQDGRGQKIAALFAGEPPIQLDFADGRVSVDHLCNRMSGGYTLTGDRLAFGRMASTMMACTDAAKNAQERAAGELLSGEYAMSLDAAAPSLVLTRRDGTTLRFTGEETAQSRYGEAETVFLEVAPQTRPCPHPLMKDKQCLQVREVHFDAQGLRQGTPGEWQNFYEDIEGYTHQDGVRNVLRLKRYTRPNPPADASSKVYVLDLVVETEQVR
jgi:heat shock protein HslJ